MRALFFICLMLCQAFSAHAHQVAGSGRETTPVPVEREGRILFIAPEEEEACTVKLKEWDVGEGVVYDVAVVPVGAVRVSKTGCRLIIFNIQGNYYGDEPPERELTVLVYERAATGVPFGDPETFKYNLKPRYLPRIIYDDNTARFYLNYTAGHH
jgi:hypothetical protein